MPTKKLDSLLKPSNDGDLGHLIQRAQQMGELTDVLAAALPAKDRAGVVAANVRECGELVVVCASSAWAARLRYESDALLKAAKKAGLTASRCTIRVSTS